MDSIKKTLDNVDKWDLYNGFFMMNDIERLRKFLVREHFFKKTLNIPGDYVELGVFKGTGMAQLIKLREIYTPGSNKKVVGFDLFDSTKDYELSGNNIELSKYYENCNIDFSSGITKDNVQYFLDNISVSKKTHQLIKGDITKTIPEFLENNPGFRVSLINFDMDIEEPTYNGLKLLYDRVVRGGVVIFDEYACDKWNESNGVDRFLKEHPEIKLETLTWSRTPTAFFIKK